MATWTIGAVSVTRVEEQIGFASFPPEQYLAGFERELLQRHLPWLVPHHYSPEHDRLVTSVHSWLIRTDRHTILLDCCGGNHKERPGLARFHQRDTPYLARLREAGAAPEDIDIVLCTHLHADHVGWNTMLRDGRWIPTFPNAKYLFSRSEDEYGDPRRNPAADADPQRGCAYRDSVLPVIEAGQAVLLDGTHAIDDAMVVEPAPGHTPGHVILKLHDRGERALFCGDALHHPLQVYAPHWNSRFCEVPEQALVTRRRLLEHCAEQGALLFPVHFGAPHVGAITERRRLLAAIRRWQGNLTRAVQRRAASATPSILDAHHAGGRAVHATQPQRQRHQLEAAADAPEVGEKLDHRNAGLEPALVVGAALGRQQRHAPERLFRETIHGDRRHAAGRRPLAHARLEMDGVVPERGCAPGPVGPQRLDDSDLAGRRNDTGPLQVVAADAGAGGLAADIQHHRIAHHQTVERKLVHRAAVRQKMPGRVDMGPDMGVQGEHRIHVTDGGRIRHDVDAFAREPCALILVHDGGRLHLHRILLVQRNLRNAGHPGDDGKREIDDTRHGVVPVHTLLVANDTLLS